MTLRHGTRVEISGVGVRFIPCVPRFWFAFVASVVEVVIEIETDINITLVFCFGDR